MEDHLGHDYMHLSTYFLWTIVILGLLIVFRWFRSSRSKVEGNQLSRQMISTMLAAERSSIHSSDKDTESVPVEPRETIFVLPDISHYSQFLADGHFDSAKAQHIIFSLINAIIAAATKTFELSKIEGDAVLFYTEANTHSADEIGQTILDIYHEFVREKHKLMKSGLCRCKKCNHIGKLGLKILVHMGNTTPFTFRGSVDHFGKDVVILYKMLKNNLKNDNYILITNISKHNINMGNLICDDVVVHMENMGNVNSKLYILT